jgi:hypothetical protein
MPPVSLVVQQGRLVHRVVWIDEIRVGDYLVDECLRADVPGGIDLWGRKVTKCLGINDAGFFNFQLESSSGWGTNSYRQVSVLRWYAASTPDDA